MIGYLNGIFQYRDNNFVIIDVNGVGYQIYLKSKEAMELKKGVHYQFFVQTFFKDQVGFELYGFTSLKEKNIFNELVKVNKVGSKTAIAILDHIYTEDLISAIIDKEVNILSSVKGIGKKTSERIILELSDKFKKKFKGIVKTSSKLNAPIDLLKDLTSVLGNLGYGNKAIKIVIDSFTTADFEGKDLEELIKLSLKRIRTI